MCDCKKTPWKKTAYEEIIAECGDFRYTDLSIRKNPNGRFYIRAGGDDVAIMYIVYCPFCGDKLK